MAAQDEARQRLYVALNAVANNSIGDVAMGVLLDHAEDVVIAAGGFEQTCFPSYMIDGDGAKPTIPNDRMIVNIPRKG